MLKGTTVVPIISIPLTFILHWTVGLSPQCPGVAGKSFPGRQNGPGEAFGNHPFGFGENTAADSPKKQREKEKLVGGTITMTVGFKGGVSVCFVWTGGVTYCLGRPPA